MQNCKNRGPCFLFILIILLSGFLSGCGKEEVVEKKELVRPVKFFEVNISDRDLQLKYSGTVSAAQQVDMAFEVPGRIIEFPVREGERVEKGTLLVTLDPRDFQIILDSRTADLNAARADYGRARELYENNTISRRDLDVARRNFEVTMANTKSAKKALDDTRLVAPFPGIIARTLTENFQNIQAKEPILVIHDDSSLEMKVDIPEQDYTRKERNTSLSELTDLLKPEISIAAVPGKIFKAWFKEAATTADPATRTFEVTMGFKAPDKGSILPGMTARLVIAGAFEQDENNIMIPAKAVLSNDDGQATVWLIDPTVNSVKQLKVEAGNMSGSSIKIKNGLKTGDLIAVSGVHQLSEGAKVSKYEKP